MSNENYQGSQNLKEASSLVVTYLDFFNGSAVGISAVGEVVIRYNQVAGLEVSQNGGAYQPL